MILYDFLPQHCRLRNGQRAIAGTIERDTSVPSTAPLLGEPGVLLAYLDPLDGYSAGHFIVSGVTFEGSSVQSGSPPDIVLGRARRREFILDEPASRRIHYSLLAHALEMTLKICSEKPSALSDLLRRLKQGKVVEREEVQTRQGPNTPCERAKNDIATAVLSIIDADDAIGAHVAALCIGTAVRSTAAAYDRDWLKAMNAQRDYLIALIDEAWKKQENKS